MPNRIIARAQSRSAGPTNGGGRAHSENGAGTRCVAAPATSLLRTYTHQETETETDKHTPQKETQERSRVGPSLTTAVLQCRCNLPLHVLQQAWRREVGRLGKRCTPTDDQAPDCREVQQRSARMNGRSSCRNSSRLYCSINIQYKSKYSVV